MATEPIQSGPYPVPADPPDGPNQMSAIVTWAAPRLVMRFASAAARTAAIPAPTAGMLTHLASDRTLYLHDGTDWQPIWEKPSTTRMPSPTGWVSTLDLDRVGKLIVASGALTPATTPGAITLTTALTTIGTLPPGTAPRSQLRLQIKRSGGADSFEAIVAATTGVITARAYTGTVAISPGNIFNWDGYSWIAA